MDTERVIEITRRWISSIVIGLNLCPFARRVFQGELIRYVVSTATEEDELLDQLGAELQKLAAAPISEIETTLLIHPNVLNNFLDYNDFLAVGERLLRALGLEGVIQIASFHPDYQFEGTEPEDVENFTNRSPYPVLQLLREESINNVAWDENELLAIPERNIRLLKSLGREKIQAMLDQVKQHPT